MYVDTVFYYTVSLRPLTLFLLFVPIKLLAKASSLMLLASFLVHALLHERRSFSLDEHYASRHRQAPLSPIWPPF